MGEVTRFDESVVSPDPNRRRPILIWLEAALQAIDPEALTRDALAGANDSPIAVLAIGKAAGPMARGAVRAANVHPGLLVTDQPGIAVPGMEALVGNHPVPGPDSFVAGRRVIDFVTNLGGIDLVALISGGGSALCEMPREGVDPGYLAMVGDRLLRAGVDISDINLVRSHLSSIKRGGLARAYGRPIDTYLISDVAAASPETIASGPTLWQPPQPEKVLALLERLSVPLTEAARSAITMPVPEVPRGKVVLLADGFTAAEAVAEAASMTSSVQSDWIGGPIASEVDRLLSQSGQGLHIAVGEPSVEVTGKGKGGRNTHAALLAASVIAGTESVFVALATDGVDGASGLAGAIVDGGTIARGGDPNRALAEFDSATYLTASGDALRCPPTGTNVADMWILWNPVPSAS